jgi:hypothetical protein
MYEILIYVMLYLYLFDLLLKKGQGPDPNGICGFVVRDTSVNVGGGEDGLSCGIGNSIPCASLDFVIYSSLNINGINPTVSVIGQTRVSQSVEISGLM